jgi:hypothetical protein
MVCILFMCFARVVDPSSTMPGDWGYRLHRKKGEDASRERAKNVAVKIARDIRGQIMPELENFFGLYLNANLNRDILSNKNVGKQRKMNITSDGLKDGAEKGRKSGSFSFSTMDYYQRPETLFNLELHWEFYYRKPAVGPVTVPHVVMKMVNDESERLLRGSLRKTGANVFFRSMQTDGNLGTIINSTHYVFFQDYWIEIRSCSSVGYTQDKRGAVCDLSLSGEVNSYTIDTGYNDERGLEYKEFEEFEESYTRQYEKSVVWYKLADEKERAERRAALVSSLHDRLGEKSLLGQTLPADVLRHLTWEHDTDPDHIAVISPTELMQVVQKYREDLEARIRAKRAGARAGGTAPRMRRQDVFDEPLNPLPQRQRFCCMKCGLQVL